MIRHDSIRGWFAYELHQQMKKNENIYILTGDLGYGMLDQIRDDYPNRFINCGAAEQAMMGMAVGLALQGKIPFVYSITTFLLYRPFETIRNYIDHERIPVKLIGSGLGHDYAHDGFSHWSTDVYNLFDPDHGMFRNIKALFPQTKEVIPKIVEHMILSDKPEFICLRRE